MGARGHRAISAYAPPFEATGCWQVHRFVEGMVDVILTQYLPPCGLHGREAPRAVVGDDRRAVRCRLQRVCQVRIRRPVVVVAVDKPDVATRLRPCLYLLDVARDRFLRHAMEERYASWVDPVDVGAGAIRVREAKHVERLQLGVQTM